MEQYKSLDTLILEAIKAGRSPLYDAACAKEAKLVAKAQVQVCEPFRVVDRRLQAMRRAGAIQHSSKDRANGSGGWKVMR